MFLGGLSNFTKSSNSSSNANSSIEYKSTSFRLEPRFGYYISKSWVIGIGLSFGNNETNTEYRNTISPYYHSKTENSTRDFGISLLTRYNKPLSKRFSFFVNGSLSTNIWGKGKNYREDINGTTKTVNSQEFENKFGQYYKIDIRPVVTYFVALRFGIEATFASVFAEFSKISPEAKNEFTASNSTIIGYSLYPIGFGLGVHYYITPKPKKQKTEDLE